MRIKLFGYDKELNIQPGEIGMLNIMNPKLFKSINEILIDKEQFNDENSFVVLNDKRVKFDEIKLIGDILEFEIDNKRVFQKIISNYVNYIHFDEDRYNQLYCDTKKLLDDFSRFVQMEDLEYYNHDVQFAALLKAFDFDFTVDNTNLIAKIEQIVNAYSKYFYTELFIFKNLFQLLNNEEIGLINYIAQKYNVCILLLENRLFDEVVGINAINISSDLGIF